MDDVFNEQPAQEETQQQEVQQVEQSEVQTPADAETTTANTSTEKHVPLAALEAERKGRQDWKEKAVRFEEEARQLRERMAERAQSQEQPAQQLDPIQQVRQEMLNERFNMSEMVARQKYEDLDDVIEVFKEASRSNPALAMALHQQVNPYEFAYREGKRIQLLKEVGDDPAAYRKKIEDEVRAQLQQQAAPATPSLPASLAGARSAAPRSAPAFTGPAPFGSLFNN